MISFSPQRFFIRLAFLIASALAPFLSAAESSNVPFPAPDVRWQRGSTIEHLASLRGKPVLLLIAPSPESHAFRQQLHELKGLYEHLATQHMIGVVAFTKQGGRIPSNVPFITLLDGPATAAAYDISGSFAVAVIGADGNLDCLSTRPLSGQRIHDLIDASYATQEAMRRP